MLCRETVAVYCENRTEHTNWLCGLNAVHTSQETHRLRYIAQSDNAACGNSHCLLWEPYGAHRYIMWAVRTSQEIRYVSPTEPNRSMLCGETVAVYCETRTEHTDTLCGQNAVRTSQETRYVCATEPNLLMLFRETVAVYCKNRMEHTDTLCGQSVPHRNHVTSPLQSRTGQCC
jgi:hypothetical protein